MKRPALPLRNRQRSVPRSMLAYVSEPPFTVEVVSPLLTWPTSKSSSRSEPLLMSPKPRLPFRNPPCARFFRPCSSKACASSSVQVSTEVGLPSVGSTRCALWLREVLPSLYLSLIHISEPTRLLSISYAVFCL